MDATMCTLLHVPRDDVTVNRLLEELEQIGDKLSTVDELMERREALVRSLFDPEVSGGRAPVSAIQQALKLGSREAVYKIRDGKKLARQRQAKYRTRTAS